MTEDRVFNVPHKNIEPMKPNHLLLFLLIAAFAGCSTPYQSKGFRGGFTEMRLAPDVFRIRFSGNGYTSGQCAEDFALLRACQLCLSNQFSCFALMKSHSEVKSYTYTTPLSVTTTTSGGYGYIASQTPGSTTFLKPGTALLIRAFPQKPDDVFTYDAAFMLNQITNHYRIKLL